MIRTVACGLLAVAVAGCGGGDEKPDAAPTAAATTAASAATTPTPVASASATAVATPTTAFVSGLGASRADWNRAHDAANTPNGYGPLLTTAYETEPTWLWINSGDEKVLGYDRYFTAGTDLVTATGIVKSELVAPTGPVLSKNQGRCLTEVYRDKATEAALGSLDGKQLLPSVYYYSGPTDQPFSRGVVWRVIFGFTKQGEQPAGC